MTEEVEYFYTCEHQNHTVFVTVEDSNNACSYEDCDDESYSCQFPYSVRFCEACSEILWKDTGALPAEYTRYSGEMEIDGLIKLGYFQLGVSNCIHLVLS